MLPPALSLSPVLCLALLLPATAAEPAPPLVTDHQKQNKLTPAELAAGWILLFDGESLYGWQPATKADWKVVDGTIQVSSGEPGLLNTTTQFADFELQAEFRAPATSNSGIFLRTIRDPRDPVRDCYELNIHSAADAKFPTGSFVGRKRGEINGVDADWHRFHVTAQGGKFQVRIDGRLALEYDDPRPIARGHIGLQLNEGPVTFRNIKLKPLGLQPIFNGRDLTGWQEYPGKASRFSVTEAGELQITNGPGQLETKQQFADFILQTEVFVGAVGLNSGIFFRSIPGQFWMGYESQIQNEYLNGDRGTPKDYGTGAIYRRQNARRVVADDQTWFTKTIVADGDHLAVWVNGILVTDFTDRRAANANPRKGLRREAGTIQLQGHDPTTNLRFRNLKIVEFAPRGANG
ncbi:MAG: DUF1080 domain-containing protein [Planctomycetes bacterium]|nr:DUF1080 domain-containing protein [Planctomycetota bacterium]